MSLSRVAESENVSSSKIEKKGALFFYINSGKLETTLTPTLDQTRLYYTILYYTPFTETFNIPVVMSFEFSSLLQLSFFSWISFYEALQSCFYRHPSFKFNILLCYTMQHVCKRKIIRFDQPLNYYSEIKRTCGYVLALDSPRRCSLTCCYDYLLKKQSSPPLLISVF